VTWSKVVPTEHHRFDISPADHTIPSAAPRARSSLVARGVTTDDRFP
jgi:hypothetical protein